MREQENMVEKNQIEHTDSTIVLLCQPKQEKENYMNVKDSIIASMDAVKGKENRDQSAKNIFEYKPIMGNILKYTVEEYKDCSLEEIMACIEGDTIQTGTALVEEDMAQTIRGEKQN